MTSIALFGTSADPPTKAHQVIIKWLSQHFDRVAVWTSDNPFKSHQTPLDHRSQMLRLLVGESVSQSENINFYPELSHPRTLETVKVARQKWPDAELHLVIGSDLIEQLPQWYNVETLLQQVQLLVVPRPGAEISPDALQTLKDMGAQVAIAPLEVPDVSSTAYRQTKTKEAVPPPVENYINQEHLYAYQDAG
ncbi:nicotinate-nucleotide adenylyltransferase [Phormidium sp. CCY1219]|uniref:nicotinate-nucleotide adenylyltransferase n=1 Tax=Phormidium sp. CCY1219 TaxID=2886104 RepID=UPI002D1ED006|nr:nicotinate-nucleotide adenylyltransferase [Phormidium sp. CCY1219]MEB3828788.1 nicotinate-nucleotide adenylyltransferase [Phormidium sp. CCY1219]